MRSVRAPRRPPRPWRVDTLAADFRLLDTWEVPIEADPSRDTFADFVRVFAANGFSTRSRAANFLFRLRFALGKLFRLDPEGPNHLPIPGSTDVTVAARLGGDDRARDRSASVALPERAPATLVYLFDDEALFEIANRTIHALIHLGWVDAASGNKTVTLAVYIKSRGWTSNVYLALISPFRHLVVYPALLATLRDRWQEARAA